VAGAARSKAGKEVAMPVPIQQQLLEALEKIDRPGTFCTSGRLPPTLPGLEVTGVGPVALPLEKRQAVALKERAHQAPYGKGTETIVDTDVRRVWEIDADQVTLANPEWDDVVAQAVRAAQADLGLEIQPLQAHLYKLLLYEPGSFFLAHRDGEKLDRMVATLVIALPGEHQGGELVVRHEAREVTVDFGPASRFQTQFAAFYADCEHEVRPLRSGFRLTLVYNLTLARSRRRITAPESREHIARVAALLERWKHEGGAGASADEGAPTKLAVLLDHQYSAAGLAFDALKGVDRARASVLVAAARQSGYDASLAVVTYWEVGSGEPTGGYDYDSYERYYGHGEEEDDDGESEEDDGSEYEMTEQIDASLVAGHFSDPEGKPLAFGQVPLLDTELVAEEPLHEGKPDREEFEGYTGNAGMTLERWYHRAAVMLWPAQRRFDVLCEAGVEAAVGGLEQMIREWQSAPEGEQPARKEQCLAFARRIIAHWPDRPFRSGSAPVTAYAADYGHGPEEDFQEEDFKVEFEEEVADEEDVADDGAEGDQAADRPRLLHLLAKLGDVALIAAWIRGVLGNDASLDPGAELGDLCHRHGWRNFRDELLHLFAQTSNETLERHARLLADWSLRKDRDDDRRHLCAELARELMAAVERWEPRAAGRDWQARVVKLVELLPPLVQAFVALEETGVLDRQVTYVLNRPKEFDLTTVQVPALLALQPWLKRHLKGRSVPLERWLRAVLGELEDRASRPPEKPTDWRRESATGCDCADCQALSHFLKDPTAQVLRLPLAEQRRRHLHQVIDGNKLDTTHVTERRGRPYTLVCTKTYASYERALAAHQVDLDQLAKIGRLAAWHEELPGAASVARARPRGGKRPRG
jgi:hypothetical protein